MMKSKKKKKLIWQIFPPFLVIIMLALVAVTSWSSSYFKSVFLDTFEKELTIRTTLLQQKFEALFDIRRADQGDIDRQCKRIGEATGTRVTVMLPTGEVVGDSFGDIRVMENHMTRPEMAMALQRKKGISIRYSATLGQQMMYIALPVMGDHRIKSVVRTALSISSIDNEVRAIHNDIFIVLFLTLLAAAAAALFVTRRIARPVEEMKKGAQAFAVGNLSARLAEPEAEELAELAVTMNQMAANLDEKIKTIRSRTKELEAVHASMQEGVIAIDNDERIITINDAAARMFGVSVSRLKARYILEIVRNVSLQAFIQRALQTHEPVEEDIVISGDKETLLNIHSTALYDAADLRMGTLIIFHDITRMRRLETMHKDFAANVSHELKTPLTAIKGFIETLQDMILGNDREGCDHFLKIIDKNVNRMIALIDDLLALSRLERLQGTEVEFENHNVAALIQGAVGHCRDHLEAKEMEITVECADDMTALVDPLLMEQAIFNVLDNAVKYSPAGRPVVIRARCRKQQVEIVVADSGNGMDSEHLPKIFNRFYRVDKARSRHEGGTGLGLAIVKHILQYHQGTIHVESRKGRGSTFTLSIPAGRDVPAPQKS